ncbi:DUF7210 family protein [Jeotgalibacillus terrae]|uniref:DUF7210 domain-containing protein n=1 Tax=Jeotgalibacillus terrae TaxID=587735 RepID=A0ABW5ZEL8_9BACL|nr:hypothetical protein [Jeotgalibacillus terrae]MBM7580014.1 hypothetical protein [Jeotgalibacillus terrae]
MSVKVNENETVRHNGKTYVQGDTITDIDEKDAERLIQLKVAAADGEFKLNLGEPDPPNDFDQSSFDGIEYAELKAAAKDAGLEFAGNISHAKLIDLVLESDKTEGVLSQFDDEDEDNE